MPASSQVLDPIRVSFDDQRAVADAGLVLTGALIGRLGLEQTIDAKVTRGYRPGRKTITVVSTLLAGGDCIDDVNLLHAGATASVVGHGTVAASTVGTWLRSLRFGHIRQLDAVGEAALTRAWQAGLARETARCSSTSTRPSARSTATPGRGGRLHPPARPPSAACHPCEQRRGPPRADAQRVGRVGTWRATVRARDHRPGPPRRRGRPADLPRGLRVLSHKVITACIDHNAQFSITVTRQPVITTAIDAIDGHAWIDIAYTDGGVAQLAETTWDGWRLIVRHTRIDDDPNLPTLFAGWRHHAFGPTGPATRSTSIATTLPTRRGTRDP